MSNPMENPDAMIETMPLNQEQIKSSIQVFTEQRNIVAKDPNLMHMTKDLDLMIANLEKRMQGLSN